ncbi:MAG TPA: dephospho-CoA kinase [Dehalococcoidia bacterium]|nr:dephospho-CoA kinase [Dehalococcoidia bacterium]
MLSIGLIGGIASGKSLVGRLLAQKGACVVDADRKAHQAYEPGSQGFSALVAGFGDAIVAPDGSIDRAALGRVVFGDPQRLAQLSAIVWPLTRRLIEQLKQEQAATGTRVFVLEAPLLIEAGWQDLVDQIWLVRSPVDVVRQRLRDRGLNDADADRRLASATDPAAAAAHSHVIIENDGDLADLESRVDAAWSNLSV